MLMGVTYGQQLTTIDGSGRYMERFDFESVTIGCVGDSMRINFHANGGVVTNVILISNNSIEDSVNVIIGIELTADLPVMVVIKEDVMLIGYKDGSSAEITGFKWKSYAPRI